jgi:hypothetical protein
VIAPFCAVVGRYCSDVNSAKSVTANVSVALSQGQAGKQAAALSEQTEQLVNFFGLGGSVMTIAGEQPGLRAKYGFELASAAQVQHHVGNRRRIVHAPLLVCALLVDEGCELLQAGSI